MDSCKDTCDDSPVGRPPTGKTPLRNLRAHNLVWFPALARTVADDTTVTELFSDTLREYGGAPLTRPLTFGDWPDASPWLEDHYPDWRELAGAVQAAAPGLADTAYIGVALWLAMTRRRDRTQQRHVVAGFLVHRALTAEAAEWRGMYDDPDALLEAINRVLDEHLPAAVPAARSRT